MIETHTGLKLLFPAFKHIHTQTHTYTHKHTQTHIQHFYPLLTFITDTKMHSFNWWQNNNVMMMLTEV